MVVKSPFGGRLPYRALTRTTLAIGLMAFLLPFASVSCGAQHVLTGTGLNMIAGGQYHVEGPVQHYSGDISFLLGFLGGFAALAFQFLRLRLRARVVASGAASVWSFVMLLVGQAHVNAEISDIPTPPLVSVRWEVGFWLALAAMGVSALLAALELSNRRALWAPEGDTDSSGSSGLPTFLHREITSRSVGTTVSGLVAVVAGLTIIAACQLPYVYYTDQAPASIFNSGFAPAIWFAAEPVGVALLAMAAGIALITWRSSIGRAVAAAVLTALGGQTFLLFLGYVGLAVSSASARPGSGGAVGMLAGAVLFAAGLGPVLTLFSAPPIHENDSTRQALQTGG